MSGMMTALGKDQGQIDNRILATRRCNPQAGFKFTMKDGNLGHQFGEVYAEKKNTHQVFYDDECCIPHVSGMEISPTNIKSREYDVFTPLIGCRTQSESKYTVHSRLTLLCI